MTAASGHDVPSLLGPVASVSHELRAPLHAIIGLAELLMDRDLATADQELALAIHRESKALQLIVDDLLDLSQIDAGKMEIVIQPVAPRSIADEIVGLFSADASAKGLDLRIELADDIPLTIRADRFRLRQVLVNLVSNAIKYTDAGTVTVQVDLMANRTLRFMVADTGCGIPDESLSNLFTPFLQSRPEDRTKGTGLGLSIVHRLVKLMAGEIYVCSSETGTTFSVRVPFDLARRTSDHVVATVIAPRSGRVLVVEDTEVNRIVAKSQLERLGHDATLVDNGQDALGLLGTETFDVVLMDWHMPGLDGLATARRYYQQMEAAGEQPVPIIMMTASVSAEARRECAAAGTADFLPKPVSLADLDNCLNSWLTAGLHQDKSADASGAAPQDRQISTKEAHSVPIERSVIDTMVKDLGGHDAVVMVIDTFINDATSRRAVLFDKDDPVSAQRAAHTLKSTTALLGAHTLSATTASIEHAFAEGSAPTAEMYSTFTRELDEALQELQTIRSAFADDASNKGSP